ncbi:hypothetical protein Q5H92_14540 [Hymenobacter sp. M29]|uniref:Uncharacterized protein n=1 Tax=Hymenobacter mellowenesis TaxID=3063995 RepID=A0ABT9ACM6_9BACT|nr:hypothetical protein [Hymenobacter sp. M29]MDO7847585.1 hypothetical protein [Hymenobacter sp. M29]
MAEAFPSTSPWPWTKSDHLLVGGWVQLTPEEVEANRRTAYNYIF